MANNGPTFTRLGPGDLPGDSSNPNSPDYVESAGGILGDFESASDFLDGLINKWLVRDTLDYLAEYMSSWRDHHAQQKLMRQFLALAESCTQAAIEQEARDALEGPGHE